MQLRITPLLTVVFALPVFAEEVFAQKGPVEIEKIGTVAAPGGPALSACTSPDGKTAFTGGQIGADRTGEIVAWDIASLRVERRYALPGIPGRLAHHPKKAVVAALAFTDTPQILLLDLTSGALQELPTLKGTRHICFRPDGRLLATTSVAPGNGSRVRLLDPASGEVRSERVLPIACIRLLFSPEGDRLYAIDPGGKTSHRELRVPQLDDSRPGEQAGSVLGFDAKGRILRTIGNELHHGDDVVPVLDKEQPTSAFALSPGGTSLFLAQGDTLLEYRTGTREVHRRTLPFPTRWNPPLATVAPADGTLLTSCLGSGVFVLRGGTWRQQLAHPGRLTDACFAADGRTLAAAGAGAMAFYDARLQPLRRVPGKLGVAPAANGSGFLLASPRKIHLIDPKTPKPGREVAAIPESLDLGFDSFQTPITDVLRFAGRQYFYFRSASRGKGSDESWFDGERVAGVLPDARYDLTCLQTHRVLQHPTKDQCLLLRANVSFDGTMIRHVGEWRFHRISDYGVLRRSLLDSVLVAGCYDFAGDRAILVHSDGKVQIRDTSTLELLQTQKLMPPPRWMAALDAERILAIRDRQLLVLDRDLQVTQSTPIPELPKDASPYSWLRVPFKITTISADRQRLAIGEGSALHVYRLKTGPR